LLLEMRHNDKMRHIVHLMNKLRSQGASRVHHQTRGEVAEFVAD
jgi:hypothetical protein